MLERGYGSTLEGRWPFSVSIDWYLVVRVNIDGERKFFVYSLAPCFIYIISPFAFQQATESGNKIGFNWLSLMGMVWKISSRTKQENHVISEGNPAVENSRYVYLGGISRLWTDLIHFRFRPLALCCRGCVFCHRFDPLCRQHPLRYWGRYHC